MVQEHAQGVLNTLQFEAASRRQYNPEQGACIPSTLAGEEADNLSHNNL